jgi:hypothetical protein
MLGLLFIIFSIAMWFMTPYDKVRASTEGSRSTREEGSVRILATSCMHSSTHGDCRQGKATKGAMAELI